MVLQNKGYGAYISCDGEPLEEFGVTQEDNKTTVGFVCSESDKVFKIHYVDYADLDAPVPNEGTDGDSPESLRLDKRIQFYVDGKLVSTSLSSYGESDSCEGFDLSEREIRTFKFQDIVTTDDESLAPRGQSRDQALGSIEVRIQRVRIDWGLSAVSDLDVAERFNPEWEDALVNERSKIVGSHCTGAGEVVESQTLWATGSEVTSYDKDDYVVFRFLYRKREVLQAQEIVPRSPRGSVKREHESDDEAETEDLEELEAQMEILRRRIDRTQRKKVKQEKD